jgi:hypothetical protein
MKCDSVIKLFHLSLVTLLAMGFAVIGARQAFLGSASGQQAAAWADGAASGNCSAKGNDRPWAAVRLCDATEFLSLRTDKLPQDEAVSGAAAAMDATAGVQVTAAAPYLKPRLSSRHSLVTQHVRLQI